MARSARNNSSVEMSLSEDELISGLVAAQGQRAEVIAFGIAYTGIIECIDLDSGFATIVDGDDKASLEFERIESFRLLNKPSTL